MSNVINNIVKNDTTYAVQDVRVDNMKEIFVINYNETLWSDIVAHYTVGDNLKVKYVVGGVTRLYDMTTRSNDGSFNFTCTLYTGNIGADIGTLYNIKISENNGVAVYTNNDISIGKTVSAGDGITIENDGYSRKISCTAAGPDEYIKSAEVSDNTLTLTDQDDNEITFQGGALPEPPLEYGNHAVIIPVEEIETRNVIHDSSDFVVVSGTSQTINDEFPQEFITYLNEHQQEDILLFSFCAHDGDEKIEMWSAGSGVITPVENGYMINVGIFILNINTLDNTILVDDPNQFLNEYEGQTLFIDFYERYTHYEAGEPTTQDLNGIVDTANNAYYLANDAFNLAHNKQNALVNSSDVIVNWNTVSTVYEGARTEEYPISDIYSSPDLVSTNTNVARATTTFDPEFIELLQNNVDTDNLGFVVYDETAETEIDRAELTLLQYIDESEGNGPYFNMPGSQYRILLYTKYKLVEGDHAVCLRTFGGDPLDTSHVYKVKIIERASEPTITYTPINSNYIPIDNASITVNANDRLEIATAPTEDGSYVLKCVVTDGVPAYSWVSEA